MTNDASGQCDCKDSHFQGRCFSLKLAHNADHCFDGQYGLYDDGYDHACLAWNVNGNVSNVAKHGRWHVNEACSAQQQPRQWLCCWDDNASPGSSPLLESSLSEQQITYLERSAGWFDGERFLSKTFVNFEISIHEMYYQRHATSGVLTLHGDGPSKHAKPTTWGWSLRFCNWHIASDETMQLMK